jgi:hypothetical protein
MPSLKFKLSSCVVGVIGALNLVNGFVNLVSQAAKLHNGRVMRFGSESALDAIALGYASVG